MRKSGGLAAYRERVSREKRASIVSAARHLFATQGFFETSMARIAEHGNVSTATLYKHYVSKEDLLAACVEDILSATDPQNEKEAQVLTFLNRVARSSLAAITVPEHRAAAQEMIQRFAADR